MSSANDEKPAFFAGFMLGSAVIVVVMLALNMLTDKQRESAWQKTAIQHNAAHYDSVTAEFKWNTPAVEVVK